MPASTASPPQPLGTPVLANRLPPLGPAEKERYRNMFANTGAQNGLLDGEQARTIFLRARLPNDTLGQIWFPPRPRAPVPYTRVNVVGVLRIFTIAGRWILLNSRLQCT